MNEAVKIPEYHTASEVSGDYRDMLVERVAGGIFNERRVYARVTRSLSRR